MIRNLFGGAPEFDLASANLVATITPSQIASVFAGITKITGYGRPVLKDDGTGFVCSVFNGTETAYAMFNLPSAFSFGSIASYTLWQALRNNPYKFSPSPDWMGCAYVFGSTFYSRSFPSKYSYAGGTNTLCTYPITSYGTHVAFDNTDKYLVTSDGYQLNMSTTFVATGLSFASGAWSSGKNPYYSNLGDFPYFYSSGTYIYSQDGQSFNVGSTINNFSVTKGSNGKTYLLVVITNIDNLYIYEI